jgi:serine/threonine-protein kinase PRP4
MGRTKGESSMEAVASVKDGTSRSQFSDRNVSQQHKDTYNEEKEAAMSAKEMEELEAFMALDEDGEDEEAAAERLATERKKRQEEILKKYQSTETATNDNSHTVSANSGTVANHVSTNSSSAHMDTAGAATAVDEGEEVRAPVSSRKQELIDSDEQLRQQLQAEKAAIDEAEARERKITATFDMFSSSPADVLQVGNKNKHAQAKKGLVHDDNEDPHLQSNWDDSEGYYKARIGEVVQDRYRTMGVVGKGVFSIVLKCFDQVAAANDDTYDQFTPAPQSQTDKFAVAIKMIRNNDIMRKAAEKERAILSLIAEKDPQRRKHCVRLLDSFEYRSHIALVFEYQQMNLREALKKFGKDVGINIDAIRLYAKQLLYALKHLADLRIVHADIKLDNILCSGDLKQVRRP